MAEEAGRLRDQDEKHAAKLSGFDLAAVMRSADPQSEALARFTGFAAPSVRDALAVLVAVLIELGSGLGLWVAAGGANHGGRKEESHATAVRQEPPPLPVAPPIEAAPGQPAPPLPGARKRPKKARKTDRPEVNAKVIPFRKSPSPEEVSAILARGKTQKQAAAVLGVSVRTVRRRLAASRSVQMCAAS